jgi:hypothetical protein
MPSPRPSGLGIWKILLFPQRLHDSIFGFVILIGYVFEPVVCPLLWVSVVRNYTCNLFIFVSLHLSSLARTLVWLACILSWLPLSLLRSLLTISDHMSWLLTVVTDDFPSSPRLTLSFPSIILCSWLWLCLFFGSCELGPCTSWGCVHCI